MCEKINWNFFIFWISTRFFHKQKFCTILPINSVKLLRAIISLYVPLTKNCAQLLKRAPLNRKQRAKTEEFASLSIKIARISVPYQCPPSYLCIVRKKYYSYRYRTVTYPTVPVVRKNKWFLTKKCIRIIVDNSTNYFINVDYYRKICTYIRMNACTPLTFLTILKILPAGFVLIRSHCHTTQ